MKYIYIQIYLFQVGMYAIYLQATFLNDTAKQPTLLHIRMYVHMYVHIPYAYIRVYGQTRVIGIELELDMT